MAGSLAIKHRYFVRLSIADHGLHSLAGEGHSIDRQCLTLAIDNANRTLFVGGEFVYAAAGLVASQGLAAYDLLTGAFSADYLHLNISNFGSNVNLQGVEKLVYTVEGSTGAELLVVLLDQRREEPAGIDGAVRMLGYINLTAARASGMPNTTHLRPLAVPVLVSPVQVFGVIRDIVADGVELYIGGDFYHDAADLTNVQSQLLRYDLRTQNYSALATFAAAPMRVQLLGQQLWLGFVGM